MLRLGIFFVNLANRKAPQMRGQIVDKFGFECHLGKRSEEESHEFRIKFNYLTIF